MNDDKANFLHLNHDGLWPDFQWQGLELRADGALQLHSLPLLEGELPEELSAASAPDGPAGIAVDLDGTVYFSDPARDRVMKLDACDGSVSAVDCIGGAGRAPGQLDAPRGLLIPAHRRSLFVADSGNDRIQVFDLDSRQMVDIWGQAGPARFDTPWTVAGDGDGNVYVVDYGNRRVQKFNRAGDLVPEFWEAMQDANVLRKPSDIAAYSRGEAARLYVVDEELHSVFVFDAEGRPAGPYTSFGAAQLQKPMGIAVTEDAVYVGDNARRRLLAFRRDDGYEFIGEAVSYQGTVAALALDRAGNILVHTGAPLLPARLAVGESYSTKGVLVRLVLGKGYGTRGVLWSGKALSVRDYETKWHRLQAEAGPIAPGARLRLFVHTSDDLTDPPDVDLNSSDPFSDPKWRPRADAPDPSASIDDLFIGGEPARYLWIGALLSGDGKTTPILSQMRVEFDQETYLDHLPAIYRDAIYRDAIYRGGSPCGDFLLRLLALFESFFSQEEVDIERLSALFDPVAAPKEFLPWLAGWLALELDEDWSEEQQRQAIAAAFETYSRRGTPEGLRESLRVFAGVSAIIEEPMQTAAWWSLPAVATPCECKERRAADEQTWQATENSLLGVTTMLASAHAQGAVLGSTATLDGSHLITGEQFGAPLFEDVAHQFSVQVYRGQLQCPERLAQVRAVIERQKPAHTDYHFCVIEPRMRVGFQARVGIDSVVAGPPEATGWGEAVILGQSTVLGGEPAARLGIGSRIGTTTRVG